MKNYPHHLMQMLIFKLRVHLPGACLWIVPSCLVAIFMVGIVNEAKKNSALSIKTLMAV